MTTKEASDIIRAKLAARYPGYWKFSASERVVLAAAILADDVKVREKTGKNDGAWVGAILGATGLSEGFAWCAATVDFCCDVAGVRGQGSAGVMNWYRWFQSNGKIVKPSRGTVAMKDYGGGKGHMGIVVANLGLLVVTIEGNTSPGESGSQRDGQGLYRRTRPRSWWAAFGAL